MWLEFTLKQGGHINVQGEHTKDEWNKENSDSTCYTDKQTACSRKWKYVYFKQKPREKKLYFAETKLAKKLDSADSDSRVQKIRWAVLFAKQNKGWQSSCCVTQCYSCNTYILLCSLIAPTKPVDKSFDEIKEILKTHLYLTPVIVERFRFHTRNESKLESTWARGRAP